MSVYMKLWVYVWLYLVLIYVSFQCVYLPVMVVSEGEVSGDWQEIFFRLEEILLSDLPRLAKEEDVPEGNYKFYRKSRMAGHEGFSFQSHHFM